MCQSYSGAGYPPCGGGDAGGGRGGGGGDHLPVAWESNNVSFTSAILCSCLHNNHHQLSGE